MSDRNIRRSLFIADLHLSDERPQANGRFFHFLEHTAKGADALYILGDLFEYWVGDDDTHSPIANQVAQRIYALAQSGTRVYFMHGNRDFLLARDYARRSGMQLLKDPAVIDLYGVPTLLLHGDSLCTDDTRYQQLRFWLRKPWLQTLLRKLPLRLRHRIAHRARKSSSRAKKLKSAEIMDVNQHSVIHALREHGVSRMIHGHTHRPAHHHLVVDGLDRERWVLPDWYEREGKADGGYLLYTPGEYQLLGLDGTGLDRARQL